MSEPGAARREYEKEAATHGDEWRSIHLHLADAALAEAEAENERLKEAQTYDGIEQLIARVVQAEAEVERLKWQRDYVVDIAEEYGGCDFTGPDVKSLDDLWAERGGGK